MINVVFGLVAVCLGIWGMVTYWWYTIETLIAIFPLVLLFTGTIALLAGIKKTGLKATLMERNNIKQETPGPTKKRDE